MKKKMLSAALLLAALLCLSAAATAELDDGTPTTAANEWQYSDIRKYLNNSVTDGQANSTTEECNSTNDSGYAAHFTDAEYALMKPTTVQTLKDVNHVNNPDNVVTTTDRIFLPSGRTSFTPEMNVLSWGTNDLAYRQEQDKTVLIPLGYWAASNDGNIWLRSAGTGDTKAKSYAHGGNRAADEINKVIDNEISNLNYVAPVFTLDSTKILFASCASAALLAGKLLESIEIENSGYLGRTNPTETTPSYGMYLKTEYEDEDIDFKVINLSCLDNVLSFEYAGGMPGDYVMIQAYEKDNFAPSGNSPVRGYVAAKLIENGRGEMSVDMTGNLMQNTANYTFKIWMENPSRVSLAQATVPQTFLFDGVSFEEVDDDEDPHKNLRMFAMKGELNCSWGDLSKLTNNDVVAGGTNSGKYIDSVSDLVDTWMFRKSCGVFASNQIIYFGVDKNDKPLRFWIAGRSVDSQTGKETLTLYQMSSDETYRFDGAEKPKLQIVLNTPEELKPDVSFTVSLQDDKSSAVEFISVSTNPRVATVDKDNKKVNIHNYGEFSIVLFSGDQILHTQTFSVVNPELKDYDYTPAGDWKDDETEEDEEQPEQPEQPGQAVQDAADGLPQTGDSSVMLLWAALLALSLAGLAARRRRSA